MSETSTLLDELRSLNVLSTVPEDQLNWLIEKSEILTHQVGDYLFKKGDPANSMYILLEGSYRIQFDRNGQLQEVGEFMAGDITGLLPYSRMTQTSGYATANQKARLLAFHKEHFQEMIRTHYELTQALVHVMTNRVRTFTSMQGQNEKLMSLGKLSAGLAHELNNPASAIVRSSVALREHLKLLPDNFKKVIRIQMTDQQVDEVNELLFSKISQLGKNPLGMLERNEMEDALFDWLGDHGFEQDESLVENLIEFGFNENDLNAIREMTGEKDFLPVMRWIDNNLETERMVEEIHEASERISELISSIKSYSHMDKRGDRQPVDIHHGIHSTINMLKHKITKNGVSIVEDYETDLPAVKGFPGELNQVWTNLIDNALDALEESGDKLELKTYSDNKYVRICIRDNGPGIPDDIQRNIFDPFFTTKEMGKGTGLGLDVVLKIIHNHRGDIKLKSKQGDTSFEVVLPKIESNT